MKPNVKIINQNDSRNTPRPTDSQQKKYCFVACYTHNIHEWSNFLNLLHVTTWIWIEMKSQLISIIDD
jgi:hypothetical protein